MTVFWEVFLQMSDLQVKAGKPDQENSVYTAVVSILFQDFLASLIKKHI